MLLASVLFAFVAQSSACFIPSWTTADKGVVLSRVSSESDLPLAWDWRNVSGVNYASRVPTQQLPHVCGSCWAEAALGALSDRFAIATHGALRVQLAVQALLNFDGSLSGGTCLGGDSFAAYTFVHSFAVPDDTCAPFIGMNWAWGFDHASTSDRPYIMSHLCQTCQWDGNCEWVPESEYDSYSIDEYGKVHGVHAMMSEIKARGPIACYINSDPPSFDQYTGGIITDPVVYNTTDHVVVIAGWGEDKSLGPYWIGRNSYGTRWGEGAGGGWFRVLRGKNTLNLENNQYGCDWAVPSASDVARAMQQMERAA